jgi:phospholipase C
MKKAIMLGFVLLGLFSLTGFAQQNDLFGWVQHKPWSFPVAQTMETDQAKAHFLLDTLAGPIQRGMLWIEWKKDPPHDLVEFMRSWVKTINADLSEWTEYEQKVKTTEGKRLLLQGQHLVLNYFDRSETMAMYSIDRGNRTLLLLGKGPRSFLTVIATVNFMKSLEYSPLIK